MNTKSALKAAVLVAVMGAFPAALASAPPDMENVPLTLTGCVVAGHEKDSYLLTNVVIDGTTLAPANAFYRFDSTGDLKKHVGRRVEVKGKADLDDVDKGRVKLRTDEQGKTSTEVSSERRTIKVDEHVWFGSMGAMKLDAEVPTYKFHVDGVKRVNGNCEGAEAAR